MLAAQAWSVLQLTVSTKAIIMLSSRLERCLNLEVLTSIERFYCTAKYNNIAYCVIILGHTELLAFELKFNGHKNNSKVGQVII